MSLTLLITEVRTTNNDIINIYKNNYKGAITFVCE